MIEFTMSRMTVIVCGVLIMAAVLAPVSQLFEERADTGMADAADQAAATLDRFWDSEADVMTLRGCDILPNPDCHLDLSGHTLMLVDGNGRSYRTAVAHPAAVELTIAYSDQLALVRSDAGLTLSDRRTSRRSSSARRRNVRCPRDCCIGTPTPARSLRGHERHEMDGRSAYRSGP